MLDIKYKNKKVTVLLVQTVFIIIIFANHLLYLSHVFAIETNIYINCLIYAINVGWALLSWHYLTNYMFSPYVLFFTASAIFNGGPALLELFGLNEFGLLRGNFSSEVVFLTILFSNISLAFFHFGAVISIKKNNMTIDKNSDNEVDESITAVGWFLFSISIIPAFLIIKHNLSIVMSEGYFGIFQEVRQTGLASAPRILANFITPAAIFLLIGGRKNRKIVLLTLALVTTTTLVSFFLGDRSGAVMPAVVYVWIWHIIIKPIPKYFLISTSLITLFVIFPLVSFTRNISGASRLDIEFLWQAFLLIENPFVSIINEMGMTMDTIAHTIRLVPDHKDFEYGMTYIYAAYSAIPNFFADLHPAKAYGTPSDWLVWAVNPWFAEHGGGYGYSFIAEGYLNFGWLGGIVLPLIGGFLFGKLSIKTKVINNFAFLAFAGSFLAYALKYTRGDMFSVVRPLLWYCLIPYILVYVYIHTKRFLKKYPIHDQKKTSHA